MSRISAFLKPVQDKTLKPAPMISTSSMDTESTRAFISRISPEMTADMDIGTGNNNITLEITGTVASTMDLGNGSEGISGFSAISTVTQRDIENPWERRCFSES